MPVARQDEAPEYPFAAPFGGLQSEVSPSQIGNTGFAEIQNLLLRNSVARIMPAFTQVASQPLNSPAMGLFDFYDQKGTRHSGAFTQTGMYAYGQNAAPGTWVNIPAGTAGPANWAHGQSFSLAAFPYEFVQTAVVGYKLFFSNITFPVQMWDGGVQGFTGFFTADDFPPPSPPGYTPSHIYPAWARYLMELGDHLVVGNLWAASESDYPAPMQVRWSAVGDGMDWSSFTAGINDIANNLGPIMGMTRIFQTGYIFQKFGVTQMIPTGNGLAPFAFITMGASARGNSFPYSLASFAEQVAVYAARDDIFVFDGTQSQPIGQRPIDGNRRLGARTRILADLFSVSGYSDESAVPSGGDGGNNRSKVYAVISSSANGTAIGAYWLFIPELNKAWIYDFNEGSWTQTFFNTGQLNGPALGSFLAQQKTSDPKWPHGFIPVDSLTIADNIGPGLAYLDFSQPGLPPTNGSINASDGWYIRSGPLDFDDNRHPHNVNKLRIVLTDVAAGMQFFIRLTNEQGYQTPTQRVTLGEGTGGDITTMVYLDNGITGKYITWELSGPKGVPFQLVEITPYPILGGEVMTRCEVVVMGSQGVQVSILPGSASLAPGQTQQFTSNVTGATNNTVVWSASLGTITAGGMYTAPSVSAATVVTITATPNADPTQSTTINISVQPVSAGIVVTITPNGGNVASGGTMQFSHSVINTSNVSVTWTASPGTISAAGLYTAPSVSSTTSATITATSVADPTQSASVTVSIQPPTGTGQIDLVMWLTLDSRTTQHLVGDPSAPYEVQYLDTDAGYPSNYPKGVGWFIKNKLGNPWDVFRYDSNYSISHWITENGDAPYQAQCQSANGTTCWLYAKAYKRNTTTGGIHIMPRYLTPNAAPHVIDNPTPNYVVRTADCEATSSQINLGAVRGITSGPFKISWGGSIDHGSGTLATAPNYDSVNGVDTIKNQYCFSGSPTDSTTTAGFADVEETYYVKGFGRVAWYYYHNGTFVQKTVNTTLASGGHPTPNFPCGPGKSWFV